MRQPLTVIITTFNESANLKDLLETLQWAEEIMIVDSFSTDNTLEIARQYTDFILEHEYINAAAQKNWAIPQATHNWVLIMDADERLPLELQKEIQNTLESPDKSAYRLKLNNYFMGQRVKYSGWQNDTVIRLFKRDECRYEEKFVHADMITNGEIGELKHPYLHYTYRDISHFLAKMERYARWSAIDYAPKTPKVTLFHLWIKPAFRFFKHYILKLGFLDGRVGFIISAIMAWGVFLRYLNIIEQRDGVNFTK